MKYFSRGSRFFQDAGKLRAPPGRASAIDHDPHFNTRRRAAQRLNDALAERIPLKNISFQIIECAGRPGYPESGVKI